MSTVSPNMGLNIPDINDEVTDFVTELAASLTKLDAIYPVGSIYMSTCSTNPGTFLGGTWNRLQGRFLIGASSTYGAGSTGGNTTHSHDKGSPKSTVANVQGSYVVSQGNNTADASSLPPYLAVYMWERTA